MKKAVMISIIVIILIVIVLVVILMNNNAIQTTNTGETTLSYMDVSVQEAKMLIDSNPDLIVIDVSPYHAEGHLPGAINYYPQTELDDAIPSLDSSATYLVYCHVDSASRSGAQKLIDAGFENVYRLDSHYSGWVAAGYEVEK